MRHVLVLVLILSLIVAGGCGTIGTSEVSHETVGKGDSKKLKAEAYLFDAKVKREGRAASVRLQVFQSDSVIGLTGRGYFGKGALKGNLTDDSLKVFFPTLKEYLYEATTDLFSTWECAGANEGFSLKRLFFAVPDSATLPHGYLLRETSQNSKQPNFEITLPGCRWVLHLTYDRQGKGWRIKEFEFNDGDKFEIKAKRREYKRSATIETDRFEFNIDPSFVRLIP